MSAATKSSSRTAAEAGPCGADTLLGAIDLHSPGEARAEPVSGRGCLPAAFAVQVPAHACFSGVLRLAAERGLRDWSGDVDGARAQSRVPDVVGVVGELAANAVEHGSKAPAAAIVMTVYLLTGGAVVLQVVNDAGDRSAGERAAQALSSTEIPDLEAESGRGLPSMVRWMADAYDVTDRDGRTIATAVFQAGS